jgi:hypothetical protein
MIQTSLEELLSLNLLRLSVWSKPKGDVLGAFSLAREVIIGDKNYQKAYQKICDIIMGMPMEEAIEITNGVRAAKKEREEREKRRGYSDTAEFMAAWFLVKANGDKQKALDELRTAEAFHELEKAMRDMTFEKAKRMEEEAEARKTKK